MAQISTTTDGLQQVDDRVLLDEANGDFAFRDFDHSSIILEKEEWPVIILGSSLVGMVTGLLLGYHGIESISFDRHKAILAHPRAAGLNFRTIEIFRQIKLEEACLQANVNEFDIDAGMLVLDKLVGGNLLQTVQEHEPKRDADITPTKWFWITQPMLEPILHQYAPMTKFNTEFGKEIVHYDEQDDGVIVVVKDLATGEYKKYKTQYLVSCDGNRSHTRKKEGIKMRGQGVLGNGLSIRFRADLSKLLGDRARHGIIYVQRPRIQGAFRQEQRGKEGLLWIHKVDGKTDFPPGSITKEDARSYLHECAGVEDDGTMELLSFAHWTLASCVADRFSSRGGRVLIAGDAAHIMPPTGALGGNTGCSDAHNLAWKLAYVLSGRASPELLRSYEQERQPVDKFVVDQATRRLANRLQGKFPRVPEEPYYVAELGHRYNHGAILPAEGDSHDKDYEDPHKPSGTAGSRFPHVWLQNEKGATESSLDLIMQNFVLFAAEEDSLWVIAANSLDLQIDTYSLHENSKPYRDSLGKLRAKTGLTRGEALLVRPDGYIAWRGGSSPGGHKEALQGALRHILGKPVS